MHNCTATFLTCAALLGALYVASVDAEAAEKKKADTPQRVKYRVTGLFMKGREKDLQEVFKTIPDIKLISVDFKNGEAIFEYIPSKAFANHRPDQIAKRFNQIVRAASHATFGIQPPRTTPLDKLQLIEIPIYGCKCKACNLGAYEAISKLPGVERATASFHEGRATAWIDSTITNREKLKAALKKRGVGLEPPDRK